MDFEEADFETVALALEDEAGAFLPATAELLLLAAGALFAWACFF